MVLQEAGMFLKFLAWIALRVIVPLTDKRKKKRVDFKEKKKSTWNR